MGTRAGTFTRNSRRILCAAVALATAFVGFSMTPSGAAIEAGSVSPLPLHQPIVGIAATPSGLGYWRVAADGGVFTYGNAQFYGSTGGIHLERPIVGIASTPTGRGYYLVASDGGVFTFGDAHFYGSTGNIHLNQPIVGIAATTTGRGYWMVASDGGIFSFGDARFYGSTGNIHLNKPIVGIATSHGGHGYWMAASDGGIFTFGDAHFYGSLGAIHLDQPIVGMTSTRSGLGYVLVAADGGVFTFGDARFFGSAARSCPDAQTVGITSAPGATGYWIGLANARTYAFSPGATAPACRISPASGVALDLFNRLNSERAARGLPALHWDGALAGYAANWSANMALYGFRHSNIQAGLLSDGRLSWAGENIAWARGTGVTAATIHTMWMQSQDHRDNMMSPTYNIAGIGVLCAPDGTLWATTEFGRSATLGPGAPSPTSSPTPFVRQDPSSAHC
jgi:uncharacterized protein YkwD